MEAADLSHHISRRFNEDLGRLRSRVLAMGGLVEEQLQRGLTALVEGDSELGETVAREDQKVDELELAIDEECNRILATRSPAAGDLRVVVATIKASTDLERIGDECEKIGRIATRLANVEPPGDRYRDVRQLGREVQHIVHDALDAFARMDAGRAMRTARLDRAIDEQREAMQRQFIAYMSEDPARISHALDIIWAVRALERIGDHSKNLCEYVIYMVHGKDIRHSSPDSVEAAIRADDVARTS